MLSPHLRRSIRPPSAFRLATNAHRSSSLPALRYRPAAGAMAPFHSSSRRNDELPKSPFQTFVDVLRDELRKNRELQENVKQLQGDVDKFQDSETMKKARAAYERARVRCLFRTRHASCRRVEYSLKSFTLAHFEYQREPAAAGCR
jgi:mitochondrial import inner membrane translocase subunit TIM44